MSRLRSHFPSTFHSHIISGNNHFRETAGSLSIAVSTTENETQFLNEKGGQNIARW